MELHKVDAVIILRITQSTHTRTKEEAPSGGIHIGGVEPSRSFLECGEEIFKKYSYSYYHLSILIYFSRIFCMCTIGPLVPLMYQLIPSISGI